MTLGELNAAAADNPALRRTLQALQDWATQIEDQFGVLPKNSSARVSPPPLATMSVAGQDGAFKIIVTNPANITTALLHELKSSETIPFLKSTTILTHANGAPGTDIDIDLPNTNRFFQLRSRYQSSGYNQPQVFGPISSGLMRSLRTPLISFVLSSRASTPILTQPTPPPFGSSISPATIRIFGTQATAGTDQVIDYDDGSADLTVDDLGVLLVYDTYYIYADDPTKSGGAVLYKATSDPARVNAVDGRIGFGAITLRSIGGGLLFAPGDSGGPTIGTRIRMADGTEKPVEQLVAGDKLKGLDSANPEIVTNTPFPVFNVPCFTLVSSTGATITISADHELQFGSGGRAPIIDIAPGDMINADEGQEQVLSKTYAGLQTVYHIPLSRNQFHLGGGIWCG